MCWFVCRVWVPWADGECGSQPWERWVCWGSISFWDERLFPDCSNHQGTLPFIPFSTYFVSLDFLWILLKCLVAVLFVKSQYSLMVYRKRNCSWVLTTLMLSVQSYVEQFVGSGEDPERIIDQAVEEMNTDLVKLRQTAAQVTHRFLLDRLQCFSFYKTSVI